MGNVCNIGSNSSFVCFNREGVIELEENNSKDS